MRLEIAAKKGARCLERGKCRNVREKANLQLTSDTTLVCPCKISSTGFFGLSKFQIKAFWFDCKSPKPSNQSTKKKRKKTEKVLHNGCNEILRAWVWIPLDVWHLPLAGMIQQRWLLCRSLQTHQLQAQLVSFPPESKKQHA